MPKYKKIFESINPDELEIFKKIFVDIITNSLIFSIKNDYSFFQIMTDIQLRINKSIVSNLKGKQNHGKIIAKLLYYMKTEINVFGRVNLPLSLNPFF